MKKQGLKHWKTKLQKWGINISQEVLQKEKTIKNRLVLKDQFWNHARDSYDRHRFEAPFLTRMTLFSNEDQRNDEKR